MEQEIVEKEEVKEKLQKTIKIKLEYPIPGKEPGTEINRIKIGRFKAKHLRFLPKNFAEKDGKLEPAEILPLIAAMANLPEELIDEIDAATDLVRIGKELESFFQKSRQLGKN